MSTVELATLGGWGTFITSLMLVTGTIFGLYQLRNSAQARRLQAIASKSSEYIEKNPGMGIPKIIGFNADIVKLTKIVTKEM